MLDQLEALKRQLAEHEKARAALHSEIESLKREVRLLRKDVQIKDAYLAQLRAAAVAQQPVATQARAVRNTAAHSPRPSQAEHDGRALRQEITALHAALAEARREVRGYQQTLTLPRYRLADRLNRTAKKLGPIHRFFKRVLVRLR